MRIKKLDIDAFGHFTDRSFPELPTGLVLIHGENEAGKSTLFSLLKAMLYGFYPVADYPYRPWHVDRYPEFRASLVMDDGTEAGIHRKLTKMSVSGTFRHNDQIRELSNHDLPVVRHVPMELYDSLYALTQKNKRELEQRTRREIDDLLLGDLGSDVLRPAREVVEELESEGSSLWRPDKRGQPADKRLREALREAGKARKDAAKIDGEIREKARQLWALEKQIEDGKEKLGKINAKIRTGEKLIPLRRKLEQIAEWRRGVADMEAVKKLPDGLESEKKRIQGDLADAEESIRKLDGEKQKLNEDILRFSDEHRRVLSYKSKITNLALKISAHEKEQKDIEGLKLKAEKSESELQRLSGEILSSDWDEAFSDSLRSIVLPDLKTRIYEYERYRREAGDIESELKNTSDVFMMSPISGRVILAGGLTGLALLLPGLLFSYPVLSGAGIALCLLAVSGLVLNSHLRRQRESAKEKEKERKVKLQESLDGVKSRMKGTAGAIRDNFGAMPVAGSLLENPDMDLYQVVESMRRILGEVDVLREEAESRHEEWKKTHADFQALTSEFAEEPSSEGIGRIQQHLGDAEKAKDDFERARQRTSEIERDDYPKAKEKYAKAAEENEDLKAKLSDAAPGAPAFDDALNEAKKLQNTVRRIADAEEQLEENNPDLEELKAEIKEYERSEENIRLSLEEIEVAKIRLNDLNEKLADLREKRGNLKAELEQSRDQVSVGEPEGEIEALLEEQEAVRTKRDRLALLANILRKADRDFRDKHQPDVLKGAGKYLSGIAKKYKKLTTINDVEGRESLAVLDEKGTPLKVEFPLSGGTLDQIYLSFRLAVVDHLDGDQEHLPLLLDETLINWDDERMIQGAKILLEAARRRQIFFFTCHGWVAESLCKTTGSDVVKI